MEPFHHSRAAEFGISPRQLRNQDFWVHPVDGVSLTSADAHDLDNVCRAIAIQLPDRAVFTHHTAALLRGWPVPRLDPPAVIVSSWGDAPHHDRRGVYVRRCEVPDSHRAVVDGLPVASPEWTIVELAEHLSLIDLVLVIDAALHAGHTTVARILSSQVRGRRGVRMLRRAACFADGRSESPWETVLRLAHEFSGIPVEPQSEIHDGDGELLVRADLRIKGTNRFAEYDGGVHRDPETHRRDLRRDRLLLRLGITRTGYTSDDLLHRPDDMIADAAQALGRSPGDYDARLFRHELEKSALTANGWGAWQHRMRRFDRQRSPRSQSA